MKDVNGRSFGNRRITAGIFQRRGSELRRASDSSLNVFVLGLELIREREKT
jgi:hypothetical protein